MLQSIVVYLRLASGWKFLRTMKTHYGLYKQRLNYTCKSVSKAFIRKSVQNEIESQKCVKSFNSQNCVKRNCLDENREKFYHKRKLRFKFQKLERESRFFAAATSPPGPRATLAAGWFVCILYISFFEHH